MTMTKITVKLSTAVIECLRIENKGKVERATTLITKMERGEVFLPKHTTALPPPPPLTPPLAWAPSE